MQWSDFKKTMILIIVSLYSFLGNSALLGPSVYIGIYSEEFKITPATASGLISYPNLAFGFGQFYWLTQASPSLLHSSHVNRVTATRSVVFKNW